MSSKKKVSIIIIIVFILAASVSVAIFATEKAHDNKIQENLDLGNKYLDELDYDRALAAYTAVLEIEPKNVEAYLGIADAYLGKFDYENALLQAQKGYDLTGDERLKVKIDEVSQAILIEEKLVLGEQYFAQAQYEGAVGVFREVLDIAPDNERATTGTINSYLELVNTYIEDVDYENALISAKEAYEATEDERFQEITDDIKAAGAAFLENKDYDSAIDVYEAIIAVEPEDTDAYLGIVDAYLGKEDYESAKDWAQTGYDTTGDEQLKAKLEEIKKTIAVIEKLEQGEKYLAEENYTGALEIFKEILSIVPNNIKAIDGVVNAYWGLVNDYIEVADFENALAFAKEAYEATGDERFQEIITNIENGTLKCQVLGHTWRKANYQQAKQCTVCGLVEGKPLQSEFEKNGLTFNMQEDVEYIYNVYNGDGSARVMITGYETFVEDATHEAKDGYVWKTITVKFSGKYNYTFHDLIDYYTWYLSNYKEKNKETEHIETASGFKDITNEYYTYSVNWNGVKYDCQRIRKHIWESNWGSDLSQNTFEHTIQVPEEYDGAVMIIIDEMDTVYCFRMD